MYKIIGRFHGEKINDVYATPASTIGAYMAYIEKYMQCTKSKFSAEAVSVCNDVFNNLPHQLKLSDDVWVKIIIEF